MNCRAFHRNLEDYLDGGLDFAGHFGMEKHAGQCIQCGKDLAGAQKLRRMTRQMSKIKAPENFEAAILDRIGREKARGGLFGVRKFWLYGFELPSIRKMALAGAGLAALCLGIFNVSYRAAINHAAPPAVINPVTKLTAETPETPRKPGKLNVQPLIKPKPEAAPAAMIAEAPKPNRAVLTEALVDKTTETSDLAEPDFTDQADASVKSVPDTNYVEYQVVGPDNRPVTFRLPVKSRMRAGQTSDDNFYLRNVSH